MRASPAARKLADELGVDLQTVTATGPGGRITSEDVQRAADGGDESVRQDWVTLDDGRRIFYVLAGEPGASPIVFIHGLAGSTSTWQMVLETFAETHQVLALDLPGHGQSDASEPEVVDYSIPGLAQVVAAVMRSLGVSRRDARRALPGRGRRGGGRMRATRGWSAGSSSSTASDWAMR